MDIVLAVLDKVVALGAFVMMPVVLFIMGMIFKMKASDALRAGITVGIGFKGISLAAGLIGTTMNPLVEKLQQLWGLKLDAVDLGVPVVSTMAFSDGRFVLMMFAGVILINIIMLVLNITKTLNVDIWNFWHYLFIGTLGTLISGNMVALVFFMATSLTPLITPAVIDAGLAEAGGNYSLFNTGEHVGFLILQVLKAIF